MSKDKVKFDSNSKNYIKNIVNLSNKYEILIVPNFSL
jgi:hypothetical protein